MSNLPESKPEVVSEAEPLTEMQVLEKKLAVANVKLGNFDTQMKHLQGYNNVLQGCIEKIVGTCNAVITELNQATEKK